MSGWPGKYDTLTSIFLRCPIELRTHRTSTFSIDVSVLLIRDMISLLLRLLKMSAIRDLKRSKQREDLVVQLGTQWKLGP